jgi:hypothetical protein
MKKKDIWISLTIIVASVSVIYFYTQRKGCIEIDAGTANVSLELRNSLFGSKTIRSDAGPTEVRAIPHRPKILRITGMQDGPAFQLESYGPWGKLSKINVENNKTTVLKLGPPFIIKPAVHRAGPQVRTIDFTIIGQAGEQYRVNRSAPVPRIKIIDENGNTLASGKFRFG